MHYSDSAKNSVSKERQNVSVITMHRISLSHRMGTQHALYPALPRGRGEIMAKADIPARRCEVLPQGADPLPPSSTRSEVR
jgi:hypothetical protein